MERELIQNHCRNQEIKKHIKQIEKKTIIVQTLQ